MDNTLLIWKYLRPVLAESEELTQYVPEAYIYPLAALSDTPFPYIIYRRDSLIPSYTKYNPTCSGWTNTITISISVYSDNYDECVYIANLVRSLLENYYIETEEIKIHPIELSSSYESYTENGFQENLVFNVTAE